MKILGIETSCDDTCIALLESEKGKKKIPNFKIISNIVSSQTEIHKKWGGVYPTLAKREHQKNLPLVLKKTLRKAKLSEVDAIAVTTGPGLDPSLWTGINFAKEIAEQYNLPIIPINHIEAHLLISFFTLEKNILVSEKINFPAMGLIVSGGHTQTILIEELGKYKVAGETRDDAAGECFDKTARVLGLGYPGGPAIASEAANFLSGNPDNYQFSVKLPRPMMYTKNFDFSFSGLKTSVLYRHQSFSLETKSLPEYLPAMAHEIQQSIIDVLIHKTMKAAEHYNAKTIVLGGGVAANNELRKQLKLKIKTFNPEIKFLVPPQKLCTDSALMTPVTAFFKKPVAADKIKAAPNSKL